MAIILNTFLRAYLCAVVITGFTIHAQAGTVLDVGGRSSEDVPAGPGGQVIEPQMIKEPTKPSEPEEIKLSDPELEARIRVMGSKALQGDDPDVLYGMWSPDSPEDKLARQMDAELYKKRLAEMEAKKQNLGALERLAVFDPYNAAKREELLPYRFSDTSRLFAMLHDPFWVDYWGTIAYTIAVVADEKSTLELIGFIKGSVLPKGYEPQASTARLRAISSLPQTLRNQEVAEVMVFLEQLTDMDFVESLNFRHGMMSNAMARYDAFRALAVIGDDKALSVLEHLYREVRARQQRMSLQAFSAERVELTSLEKEVDRDLELLEMHLSRTRAKRLDVPVTLDGNEEGRVIP